MKKLSFSFRWYDFFMGFYYDRKKHILYWCPLPCCVFKLELLGSPPKTLPEIKPNWGSIEQHAKREMLILDAREEELLKMEQDIVNMRQQHCEQREFDYIVWDLMDRGHNKQSATKIANNAILESRKRHG